jgi:hypothetical protein
MEALSITDEEAECYSVPIRKIFLESSQTNFLLGFISWDDMLIDGAKTPKTVEDALNRFFPEFKNIMSSYPNLEITYAKWDILSDIRSILISIPSSNSLMIKLSLPQTFTHKWKTLIIDRTIPIQSCTILGDYNMPGLCHLIHESQLPQLNKLSHSPSDEYRFILKDENNNTLKF